MNYKKQKRRGKQNTGRDEYRPMQRRKYYLKSRWIFTGLAIAIALFISAWCLYFQRQNIEKEFVCAEIVYVIDGDTIIVLLDGREEKVRMIGIDAPESVSAAEEENTVYGEKAADYTKANLQEGIMVYLTFDKERTDIYGRTLAYIWLNTNFNEINNLYQNQMVSDGYATAVKYEPNTLYWQVLEASMMDAATNKRGLWGNETFYEENIYEL